MTLIEGEFDASRRNAQTDPAPDPAAVDDSSRPAAESGAAPQLSFGISEARKAKKGQPDLHGDTVSDVFVSTDHFIIYIAANRSGDRGRLRYVLPDDNEAARQLRGKMMPIVGALACVGDVIAGLPERGLFGLPINSQYATLRKRTLDLMARAMQAAFEDQADAAATLMARAQDEVVSRRDSRNRMRYIFANALALAVILAAWLGGGLFGWELPQALTTPHSILPAAFSAAEGATTGAAEASMAAGATFRAIDVLALGALGAFFAVSAAINQVKVNHTISFWEMIYAGFVRVPIGVIAAGVVIFLISGGWILASISDAYRLPSLYLFGFLAGFSELFVPNALKQVETGAKAQPPK